MYYANHRAIEVRILDFYQPEFETTSKTKVHWLKFGLRLYFARSGNLPLYQRSNLEFQDLNDHFGVTSFAESSSSSFSLSCLIFRSQS